MTWGPAHATITVNILEMKCRKSSEEKRRHEVWGGRSHAIKKIECSKFSLGFLEHSMLLLDSWHGKDARLTLISGTEDDSEESTLV